MVVLHSAAVLGCRRLLLPHVQVPKALTLWLAPTCSQAGVSLQVGHCQIFRTCSRHISQRCVRQSRNAGTSLGDFAIKDALLHRGHHSETRDIC